MANERLPDWGRHRGASRRARGRRPVSSLFRALQRAREQASYWAESIRSPRSRPLERAVSRVRTLLAARLRTGWKRSGGRIRPAATRALPHPVRRRRWPSTRRCQRTRRSFTALGEKPRECAGPSFNRSEHPPRDGRANQGAAAFEVLQPLVERRLPPPPDQTDLRHWLPSIRDGDGLSFAHLPNDLGEPRLCFVD